jgi:hypothetical protein
VGRPLSSEPGSARPRTTNRSMVAHQQRAPICGAGQLIRAPDGAAHIAAHIEWQESCSHSRTVLAVHALRRRRQCTITADYDVNVTLSAAHLVRLHMRLPVDQQQRSIVPLTGSTHR